MKPINPGQHPQKGLNECDDKSPLLEELNLDIPQPHCPETPREPSKQNVASGEHSWVVDASNQKIGIGRQANCDPMQTGQIVNDLKNPDRNHIYRYSKALRGADEAVMDLFRNIVVIDEDGGVHPVPIIWATQERAVAYILQENTRKDNSLVVDRIKLPMLAIHSTEIAFNQNRYLYHRAIDYLRDHKDNYRPGFTESERYERDTVFGVTRGLPVDISYTLYAWTTYVENMNQILEQILLKFSPIAYIKVRGVSWETIVRLDSMANNLDVEPGDKATRVAKFQFNLTAETYIPQPITRKKAVLKTKVDFFNSTNEEEITDVLARLEEAVEELR